MRFSLQCCCCICRMRCTLLKRVSQDTTKGGRDGTPTSTAGCSAAAAGGESRQRAYAGDGQERQRK